MPSTSFPIRVLLPSGMSFAPAFRHALETGGNGLVEVPMTHSVDRSQDPDVRRSAVALASGEFDWLMLTSKAGARAVATWHVPATTQIAAVGPATAHALTQSGRLVGCMSTAPYSAAALADAWIAQVINPTRQHVLIAQSAISQTTLADRLRASGAMVRVAPIYTVEPTPIDADVLAALGCASGHQPHPGASIDVVVATSSSALNSLHTQLLARTADGTKTAQPWMLIALGKQTANTAIALGFAVDAIADAATAEALITAIRQRYPNAVSNS